MELPAEPRPSQAGAASVLLGGGSRRGPRPAWSFTLAVRPRPAGVQVIRSILGLVLDALEVAPAQADRLCSAVRAACELAIADTSGSSALGVDLTIEDGAVCVALRRGPVRWRVALRLSEDAASALETRRVA